MAITGFLEGWMINMGNKSIIEYSTPTYNKVDLHVFIRVS